jgi:hypothetical protein
MLAVVPRCWSKSTTLPAASTDPHTGEALYQRDAVAGHHEEWRRGGRFGESRL